MKNIILLSVLLLSSCSAGPTLSKKDVRRSMPERLETNITGDGPEFEISFYGGPSLYYPLMAFWLENENGEYIQTLFVPRSVATGVFRYGSNAAGKWVEAAKRAPQTLPYWSHKRGIKAADGLFMPDKNTAVPDAYSGATPASDFVLVARADNKLPERFRLLLEINQNWDWNEYWTNDKFPGDKYYMSSCQPAVVYECVIDSDEPAGRYVMKPAGHSHPSGTTGELFPDISTLTTALQITDSLIVRVSGL